MIRIFILVFTIIASAIIPAAASETLYDAGPAGVWGIVLCDGSAAEELVQPFQPKTSAWADRIGVAIATASDPNHNGFRVTMTATSLATDIPGKRIAGSWTIYPVSGAALAYSYIDINPVYLDYNEVYGLICDEKAAVIGHQKRSFHPKYACSTHSAKISTAKFLEFC